MKSLCPTALYNPALLVKTVLNTNMTHAHFYKPGFDQVVETDQWILGRQGDTYVALYSYQTMVWSQQPEYEVKSEKSCLICIRIR